ncbi:hypothetical protein [Streptomyces noursei]|nr:hypothetical protein [Streptomyces noursei]
MKRPDTWLDEHGIGWRQIAAQVLLVSSVAVVMVLLLVVPTSSR